MARVVIENLIKNYPEKKVGKIDWKHDASGLTAQLPAQKPCEHATF